MTSIPRALPGLALLATLVPSAPAVAAPPTTPVTMVGQRAEGPYLPDTTVLLRVGDRTRRVSDYVRSWFASMPEYRPAADSAGRVAFLNSMVDKEVLGLLAKEVNRPLAFEDRAVMREHEQRVLSNVLYKRAVVDSVTVGEDEIRRVYERQYGWDYRLQRIVCRDEYTAGRVREMLAGGKLAWNDALARFDTASDTPKPDGDLGFQQRLPLTGPIGVAVGDLQPGQISRPVPDPRGYLLFRLVERRRATPLDYRNVRPAIQNELMSDRIAERAQRLQDRLLAEIRFEPDTAALRWAAARFPDPVRNETIGGRPHVEINMDVPAFAPEDLDRVLARHRDGELTLRQFLQGYGAMSPLVRPTVSSMDALRAQVGLMVLEPSFAKVARERGLDRDPMAVELIEKRLEELRVEHLFQDSVQSRVFVTRQQRLKEYEQNKQRYWTFPEVRYAALLAHTRAEADSLAGLLLAGRDAAAILQADSLRGLNRGRIQTRRENEGTTYRKLLFEDMRPGQVRVEGPDQKGDYVVIQSLAYDPGRQLSFPEVESLIDESLQNQAAEAALKAFIARHRSRQRVEAHPELVTSILLRDPNP
jgi:hypothetical protein